MRLTFTFLFVFALLNISFAQGEGINELSPFPVDFVVTSPSAAAGVYDYGTMVEDATNPIWGPQLSEDLAGELVWAYNQVDSLGCEELDDMGNIIGGPILNDVMGKVALVRRGACAFSSKVRSVQQAGAIACVIVNHYDDATQDGTTLVGMLGTPPADDIVIPACFIGRNTGEIITAELDAGNSVNVSFNVKSFYDPVSSYSYHTPLSEALDVDVFRINYVNPSPIGTVDVNVTAVVTDPSGGETTLTGTSSVAALSDSIVTLDDTYLPTELGLYSVEFSNDINGETASSNFLMTDYTYAPDNGDIANSSVGPSDVNFASLYSFTYQVGSLVVVDGDGAVATHASFGIGNAAVLATGDVDADQIAVILYDADQDDDGVLDFPEDGGSFDDLGAVALTGYTITGNEQPDELITVELEDLFTGNSFVELKPDGAYYIVLAYDGTNAGTGIAPRFASSENIPYATATSAIFLDQLYTGGWANSTVAVRLQLDGFDPINAVNDLPELAASTVTIAPNPVQDRMNVRFDFEELASEVNVRLLDVTGKLLDAYQYDNMLEGNVEINTANLSTGTYFLIVETAEGYRAEKVIKQ